MSSSLALARKPLCVFIVGTVAALATSAGACAQGARKPPQPPPLHWNPSATKAAAEVCRTKLAASGGKVGPVKAVIGGRIPNRGMSYPASGVRPVREKDLRMLTAKVKGAGMIDLFNPTYVCFFEDMDGSFRFIQTCWMSGYRFQSCDLSWLVGNAWRPK
jgi:hypothetical protein